MAARRRNTDSSIESHPQDARSGRQHPNAKDRRLSCSSKLWTQSTGRRLTGREISGINLFPTAKQGQLQSFALCKGGRLRYLRAPPWESRFGPFWAFLL